jgi:hypothetical protein
LQNVGEASPLCFFSKRSGPSANFEESKPERFAYSSLQSRRFAILQLL